jgi:hypothetical protein
LEELSQYANGAGVDQHTEYRVSWLYGACCDLVNDELTFDELAVFVNLFYAVGSVRHQEVHLRLTKCLLGDVDDRARCRPLTATQWQALGLRLVKRFKEAPTSVLLNVCVHIPCDEDYQNFVESQLVHMMTRVTDRRCLSIADVFNVFHMVLP